MSRQSFINRNKAQSKAYYRSPQQEKELASRGRGTITPGSGNKAQKGDVRGYMDMFLIEAKTTSKKSFSVTKDMINKIQDASIGCNEYPAIVIEFLSEDGTPDMEVAVVPMYVLGKVKK